MHMTVQTENATSNCKKTPSTKPAATGNVGGGLMIGAGDRENGVGRPRFSLSG